MRNHNTRLITTRDPLKWPETASIYHSVGGKCQVLPMLSSSAGHGKGRSSGGTDLLPLPITLSDTQFPHNAHLATATLWLA